MTSASPGRRRGGRHAAPGSAGAATSDDAGATTHDDAAAVPADPPSDPPTAAPADVPPGAAPAAAAFGRLVAVMDRLRSPGGCPWDAEQTHASLVPYALEEVHELAEAVDAGDRAGLREELGDVLLQVVFHARVAQEDTSDPFDVTEVADRLVAKLVRRHPHVFGDEAAPDTPAADLAAGDVHRRWDDAKRAEKPARASALDGVPASLGALARTQKVAGKAARAGLLDLATAGDAAGAADVGASAGAAAPTAGGAGPGTPVGAPPGTTADDVPPATDPVAPEDREDVDAAVAVVTGTPTGVPAPADADLPAAPDAAPDAATASDAATAADAATASATTGPTPPTGAPAPSAGPPGDAVTGPATGPTTTTDTDAALGARLLALVLEAERDGVDAEGALRRAAAAWEVGLRAAERGDATDDAPPWR